MDKIQLTKVTADDIDRDENIFVAIRVSHTGQQYNYYAGFVDREFLSGDIISGTFYSKGWDRSTNDFNGDFMMQTRDGEFLYLRLADCDIYKFNWRDFFDGEDDDYDD